ncbi:MULTISPECIES: phosphotransferase [Rhizobium]|uniref:phosphotransferase n=1 Tax=Rhizobium TaxID=379 RepID=UPI00103127A2|nr:MULTISPECIES: phosphotransferase [Rhizobium]TAZ53232.1 aminoglycoside phosphotransferase family protein [Rhizobium ruizarguesonis]WSG77390.1 phosphotransferase [Rhizobium beringeri]WSG92814.1 phosphotransferase [Rhizobium beringeri]WSH17585.1 phosphotransferase [Rhizobium beringeri]
MVSQMNDKEIPMTGGRITAGVVRLGNTIRRPITTDRSHVHDLLRCLEEEHFSGVPRFLGIDERNREILSFLPGSVPSNLDHFDDEQLSAAAALLRRFHDATVSLVRDEDGGTEVICHNDWGPPNAVFVDGLPTGIIDFDTISPGLRLWDLGYSAFAWLDLGNPDYTGDEQIRRLFAFAKGYGMKQCSAAAIATYAVARQTALAVSGKTQGSADMAAWAESAAMWTVLNVTERLAPTGYGLIARV